MYTAPTTLHSARFYRYCIYIQFFSDSPTAGPDCFNVTKRSELLIWIVVIVIVQLLIHLVLDIYRVGTEDETDDG